MRTSARLVAFALLLVLLVGGGWALGAAVGPIDVGGTDHGSDHGADRPDGADSALVQSVVVSIGTP